MRTGTEKKYTDFEELVDAIRANDDTVLQEFYQHNYPKVEKYVIDNNGTSDEARDIFQEAFIAVWRNIQLNRFELRTDSSPHAYLFRVAKYKWLDQLRLAKRKHMIPLTGDEEIEDLPETIQQRIVDIKASLNKLGEMCRDILERFYYSNQSMRIIAEARQLTEATAKNNKYRCLQRLRELLKTNSHPHE